MDDGNFRLSPEQQSQYDALDDIDKNSITTHIDIINRIQDIIPDSLQESVRNLYIQQNPNQTTNITDKRILDVVNIAKTEIINENKEDITNILNGAARRLRITGGRGIDGILINRAVVVLSRPVGGKLRKTSNKKKRRSSKARKARQSRKARTTRRK